MQPSESGVDTLFLLLLKAENYSLVSKLSGAGIEFVVVGGTALAYHGVREITKVDDLDLLVSPTLQNADRICSVLAAAGVPLGVPFTSIARANVQVPLKFKTPFWAEILTPTVHMDFSAVYAAASVATKDGLSLRVADVANLRQMKELAVNQLRLDLKKHEADLFRLQDTWPVD